MSDALLTADGLHFTSEPQLSILSTFARDGSIHAVPVGFTYHEGIVRIITSGSSQKVVNIKRQPHATVAQVDGGRWLSLAGNAAILSDPDSVADAVQRYTDRYRAPRANVERVVIAIAVSRVLGSPDFRQS